MRRIEFDRLPQLGNRLFVAAHVTEELAQPGDYAYGKRLELHGAAGFGNSLVEAPSHKEQVKAIPPVRLGRRGSELDRAAEVFLRARPVVVVVQHNPA